MALVVAACGPRADETFDPDRDRTVTTASYVDQGRELYDVYCGACHGDGAVGTTAGPSLLDPIYHEDSTNDTAILIAVAEGAEDPDSEYSSMPPIPAVSHSDVARITAYLRELQQGAG